MRNNLRNEQYQRIRILLSILIQSKYEFQYQRFFKIKESYCVKFESSNKRFHFVC